MGQFQLTLLLIKFMDACGSFGKANSSLLSAFCFEIMGLYKRKIFVCIYVGWRQWRRQCYAWEATQHIHNSSAPKVTETGKGKIYSDINAWQVTIQSVITWLSWRNSSVHGTHSPWFFGVAGLLLLEKEKKIAPNCTDHFLFVDT